VSAPLKVVIYVLLAIIAGISGYFAFAGFGRLMERSGDRYSELERTEPERPAPVEEPRDTNAAPGAPSSQAASPTNLPAVTTNTAPAAANLAASATNAAGTNGASAKFSKDRAQQIAAEKGSGRMGLWTALFVLSLAGLGLFAARDLANFFGNRALRTLYNDDLEGVGSPDYEKAEEVWASGRHLEAIGLMREYLVKNPREQHAAIRIAEIYEKDLGNHLAAALEYEEVLKHKLPDERWGWSAIHLCNLYFKLNHEEKAFDLLRRLVSEYPNTAAAEKGRKRLEQVDGAPAASQEVAESQSSPSAPPPADASSPGSQLPPGFRPKK